MTQEPPPLLRNRPLRAADLWALAGTALLLSLAWRLSSVLLLGFAGVLFALVLHRLAAPLHRRLGLPQTVALVVVVLGLTALTVFGLWFAGNGIAEQVQALREDGGLRGAAAGAALRGAAAARAGAVVGAGVRGAVRPGRVLLATPLMVLTLRVVDELVVQGRTT